MLLKLCADRHSQCKWPRGRKHHTWMEDSGQLPGVKSVFSSFFCSWPLNASMSSSGGWITTLGISSLSGDTSTSGAWGWVCWELLEVRRLKLGLEGGLFWGVGTGVVHLEPAGVPALEEGRRWLRRRDKGDSPLKERFEADRPVRKEWREADRPSPKIKQISKKYDVHCIKQQRTQNSNHKSQASNSSVRVSRSVRWLHVTSLKSR